MTHAPLIAGGVLITGISGGEYGTRGFLDGWDLKTGEKKWHRCTTAAPGEKGGDTWKGDDYKTGGAPTWLTGTYDPELDLVYWGTGNGGPWNAGHARRRFALHRLGARASSPKTGEIVWHYQFSPGDPYDYDGTNELVLADLPIGGKPTKVLMQANRNGFFYVLDRATGKLLSANQFARKVNWASGIDMTTGRPIDTPMTAMVRKTEEMTDAIEVWPSAFGGKNWMPMSYDPQTQARVPEHDRPRHEGQVRQAGAPRRTELVPRPRARRLRRSAKTATAARWSPGIRWPARRCGTCRTSRRSGRACCPRPAALVFTGSQTGQFMAFDGEDGNEALDVPDRLGHHRAADHVGARRPPVRDRVERRGHRLRRAGRRPRPGQRARRRLGVDLRAARGPMNGRRTIALACALAAARAAAQRTGGTPMPVEAGRKLYTSSCARCHGINLVGQRHRLRPAHLPEGRQGALRALGDATACARCRPGATP